MQPQWVPTNLKFEIEDCTADWTFTPASFDFIHMRFLVGSIQNWTELFRQAYAATKPGGWVESGEGSPHMRADNGSVPDRSAISQWGKFFEEGGAKMGRSFLVVEEGTQRRAMEQAGFVDIGERDFKVSGNSPFSTLRISTMVLGRVNYQSAYLSTNDAFRPLSAAGPKTKLRGRLGSSARRPWNTTSRDTYFLSPMYSPSGVERKSWSTSPSCVGRFARVSTMRPSE